jgi:ornithine cyclodeaminase/alanine dehydrogenase
VLPARTEDTELNTAATILLQRGEIADLLSVPVCFSAVEEAFRSLGDGRAQTPGTLGLHCEGGGFHIKAGFLSLKRNYFAAKVNANFPGNPSRFGLPTIQGVIVLCDATNGQLLAVMDSMEVTARRTAAATAVAAKYLARPNSKVLTICGCGQQGRAQLRALAATFELSTAYAWDANQEQAQHFAADCSEELGIKIEAVADFRNVTRRSDICVTCTTSKEPFFNEEDVGPGTFIAAVGADHPDKQELDPVLFAKNKVVVDLLEQCAAIGDLHHAIAAGVTDREHVYAELGEVVAGKRSGRSTDDEITIFDSTGMALQDVAVAAVVFEKAIQQSRGRSLDFAA